MAGTSLAIREQHERRLAIRATESRKGGVHYAELRHADSITEPGPSTSCSARRVAPPEADTHPGRALVRLAVATTCLRSGGVARLP